MSKNIWKCKDKDEIESSFTYKSSSKFKFIDYISIDFTIYSEE